jgi:SAM-dependent methyltransferase
MYVIRKIRNVTRGILQMYGPKMLKRSLWDYEFSRGRWDCLEATPGDVVYPYVERYSNHGSILDLGCGSGSTGNELAINTYGDYTGVDISAVAIEKAKIRSRENHRTEKNSYLQSDIFSYTPTKHFNVILFRESIYYVPRAKIKPMLDRYSSYLETRGVFIVRMIGGSEVGEIVDTISTHFAVVERHVSDSPQARVLVFTKR